ncbi:30S ribosomal protein S20 [Thermodesulforhabdus norvegica]|uniref:Small ribosomal subunit protein bS20 n=1 Tax=Thermodesulforhabdus norvegica TaxID=39841 RepID=A0A1I4TRI4_9BACT|nr:30S ribosomal protein S20 [Thermodesulforhabdus norvegica]SFM79200.1 SSU ribosomal protein S20P [Thermodesulforhabdus norvegica]
MPHHKSAIKRMKQNEKRRMRNRARKSRMKTAIRAVEQAMFEKDIEKVQQKLREAVSVIARTAAKGTIHPNKAARKISRLTRRVNRFLAEQQAA